MTKKIDLDSFYRIVRSNIFIIFVFALLSFFSSFVLWHAGFVSYAWDMYFHWQRIYELKYELINGNFWLPVSLNRFSQSGSAVMSMYPKMSLIPMVVLSFFVHSFVHLTYITFILRNFLGLMIAYFTCYLFDKDKAVGFIFAVSYTFTTMALFYDFIMMDMGVSSSLLFLPLVLFGSIELVRNDKWNELTLGLILILLCHILTAIFAIVLFFVLVVLNSNPINVEKNVKKNIKVMVLFILTTSIFWLPFFALYVNNKISMPQFTGALTGNDFNGVIISIFNNQVNFTITIIAVVGIILTIVRYKYLGRIHKQLFWIAIMVIVICSSLFPWNLLGHTFLVDTFQYTWRLYVIPQLLLTYLFAFNLVIMCRNNKKVPLLIILVTTFILIAQATAQKEVLGGKPIYRMSDINTIVNDSNYYYTDYFPKNSVNIKDDISNHQIIYDNNRKTITSLLGSGKFSFKLDKSSKSVKIPFLIYNDIDYQVKVDGKNSKFHSDNHSQLTLKRMNKGKHTVQVIVHKSWYDYLSYVLSTLGAVILAFSWIRSLTLKRKN